MIRSLPLLTAALLPLQLLAQAPATAPAAPATAPAATATPTLPATNPSGAVHPPKKPNMLFPADRTLVKNAAEAQLALLHIAVVGNRHEPVGPDGKKFSAKVVGELNKAWGDLAAVAQPRGAEMPKTEQSPAEKREVADIKKEKEKLDDVLMKALVKRTKTAAAAYAGGAKSAQDADLRAYFAKWQPKFAGFSDEAIAIEAKVGKK